MDFHCHLDLYPNARDVYKEASRRNEFTWLVTTSPRAFLATSRVLGGSKSVLVTPGLHPEIAYERRFELAMLLEQMAAVHAVGEVGLDGSSQFRPAYNVQRELFDAVVGRCVALGGRTLSIHSRQAVGDVLETLDRHPGFGTAVLHWFTGTEQELQAAVERGCWFSLGPAAFASANGRRLAAKFPRNRVVPESDGPFAKLKGQPVMPWSSVETAKGIASFWAVSVEEAATQLHANGRTLREVMATYR